MSSRERILRDAAVVAQRVLPVGTRRPATVEVPAVESPAPAVDVEMLREIFSGELAELRNAAREAGFAEARAQAQAELAEARKGDQEARAKESRKQQAAIDAAHRELDQVRQQFDRLIADLEAKRKAMLVDLEPALIDIIMAGVLKIVGRAAKEETLVRRLVATQLARLGQQRPLRIRVARQDLPFLQRPGDAGNDTAGVFVADDTLAPGECLIETDCGTLDAGVQMQLAAFGKTLHDAYREGRS